MKDFAGKKVYVVGGSAGIGLAAARLLSEKGAHVYLFARTPGRLEEALAVVAECCVDEAQCFACMPLDATDPDQTLGVFSDCAAKHGAPDILINCAGRAIPRRFEDITLAQFEETLRMNLMSIWNTTKAVVPMMRQKGGGYIVNTSSVAGFVGVYGYTDYSASKFAVIGFSEALRSELLPENIVVSVLCPPDTDTPGYAEENRTKPPETVAISEGAKLLPPEAVARALVKGMKKEKFLIVPGFDGKATLLAKRLAPGVVEGVMQRTIRKVREEKKA